MKILIQNRQRRHKIALSKISSMASKLALAVIKNLSKNKPKACWLPYLDKIDKFSTLSLIFVSPKMIKKLNKDWRNKDNETDVLSFPLLDLSSPDIVRELRFLDDFDQGPKPVQPELFEFGELFISYEQAMKQAKEFNHSLDRELAFLFVHGLLHIFGFDHENSVDEKEMFGRQRKILDKCEFFR